MSAAPIPDATGQAGEVEAIRRFNRFYTRQIGLLNEGLLDTPFSLTESRLLYEVAHRPGVTAGELGKELGLDAGYLSRILGGLQSRGLVAKTPSPADGRQYLLALTPAGESAFAPLNARAREQIGLMLGGLTAGGRRRLVRSMRRIEELLAAKRDATRSLVLRGHRPGDMGLIVRRHAVLYHREYGFNAEFEALVAEIAARFLRDFDDQRERCWIAELEGEFAGCVLLAKASDEQAKLRCLLVEPEARGFGIGRRLVAECIQFARQSGYRRLTLWTNEILVSARRIYEAAGFRLVKEERHHSFGCDLTGQYWDLDL